MSKSPRLHTADEIARARAAAQRAAAVLDMITPHVRAGVSTEELDQRCHDFIVHELRCVPANVGYHGYPKTLCTSINEVVCHGIPSPKAVLKDGDIVNLDVAVVHEGWFGDTSRMFCVGSVSPKAQRVVDAAFEAMWAGIRQVRPGATLGDVGHAIQRAAQQAGCQVVHEYGGHGIGQIYHDALFVASYGQPGQGVRLQPGMLFTIEPMLNAGGRKVRELADGWTVVTADRSLSAQWEHMVAVTADGFEVLTAPAGEEPAGPG
ncbi:methionyl aminopeptidase [Inhella inkyongensis]|uniref:Methionine aminopeptidase n=1 Tax=Inhella inkyongensis TaxID=392593 RepID=A0A840S361_9BURK|nr:type I methionyl aminopeptidase [Inhella inkyongensis]MBB5202979.1 methionyl aminopeptidase [Inhella inkyongensis]